MWFVHPILFCVVLKNLSLVTFSHWWVKADDKCLPTENLTCEAICVWRIGTQGLISRGKGFGHMVDPFFLGGGCLPPPKKKKGNQRKNAVLHSGGFSVGLHLPVYLHQKINLNILIISPEACYSCYDFVILGEYRKSTKIFTVGWVGCPASTTVFEKNYLFLYLFIIWLQWVLVIACGI